MNIKIKQVDYNNKQQASELTFLLNEYAKDPMGGGESLTENALNNLASELSHLPHAFSIICYVNDAPAGLANCFEAFSTFTCKPLVNIHDLMVLKNFRGQGLSQKLLEKVEEIAISKDCCKITLEVLNRNEAAKSSYKKFGFSDYELDPASGSALFWHKHLNT